MQRQDLQATHWILQVSVTLFNLIPYDVDVVVAVSSGLLVPEAQSVQELVLNSSQTIAVITDGQPLTPHMLVTYRGEASTERYTDHSFIPSSLAQLYSQHLLSIAQFGLSPLQREIWLINPHLWSPASC